MEIMGIVNVTTDSFSDGGAFFAPEKALAQAQLLLEQGATMIDVGGESTRPGATRVSAQEELDRVMPVVSELAAQGVRVSVDTMRAEVAQAALVAGAELINDVSGGRADADMFAVVAKAQAKYCLMHWRAEQFGDAAGTAHAPGLVVDDVIAELSEQVTKARAAGITEIIVDPGLGFAKTAADNWQLLRAMPQLKELFGDVLIGHSRKRFLQAETLGAAHDLEVATATVSMAAYVTGMWGVRVHDVAATKVALKTAAQMGLTGQVAHGL